MTMYELNQANYANLPTMTEQQLKAKVPYIVSYLDKHRGSYYLLLEKEQRYYTFFTFKDGHYNPGRMAGELIDIVADLGDVKAIETDNLDNMLEIWITSRDTSDGECSMYGFFNYDGGVIEV